MASAREAKIEHVLRRLVAANSSNLPGGEEAAARVIISEASKLGLPAPDIFALAAKRPNVIFSIGSGGPVLFLGAHLDTVPAETSGDWLTNPFELASDGRWYRGLGVADMKGAAAVMLVASAGLQLAPNRGTVLLAFTADEEGAAEYGLQWLCDEGLVRADAAVLLEPASESEESWDALYLGQRGSCVLEITSHGIPGHSSLASPAEPRAGALLVEALNALAGRSYLGEIRDANTGATPLVNAPTMLEGGITPWQHPVSMRARIEIRTVPGMSREGVLSETRKALSAVGLADRVVPRVESWSDAIPCLQDERLIEAARSALKAIDNPSDRSALFPATTDASFLERAGIPTIPALGPGSLQVVHQPNERIGKDDLTRTATLIEAVVERFFAHSG